MIDLIPSLWGYVAAAVAAIFAIGAAYMRGRRDSATRAENRALRADAQAHERITDVERKMGGVVTDDDVLDGLCDAAKRLGN